jgi:hypothetical protein
MHCMRNLNGIVREVIHKITKAMQLRIENENAKEWTECTKRGDSRKSHSNIQNIQMFMCERVYF